MRRRAPVRSRSELLQEIEDAEDLPIERLGQTLIGMGLITEADLGAALSAQRQAPECPVGELLVRQGRITQDQLETALNLKLGFAVVDLERFEIEPQALARVPWPLVERTQALPLLVHDGQLVVAMPDPKRQDLVDELSWASGCWVRPVLADPAALARRIASGAKGLGRLDELASAILPASGNTSEADAAHDLEDGTSSPAAEDGHALVRLLNQLLIEAHALGASDIHIETQPGREPIQVRLRRDGVLQPHLELPHTARAALVARIKVMARLDTSERRRPQDGRIRLVRGEDLPPIDLRVATLPTREGLEDVVLRVLGTAEALPLEALDLESGALSRLREAIGRPHGLILCAGPTGSGKTTTLHAALALLNTPQRKIWTAEDPIEIVQPGLRQVQVQARLDWTFARALRAFLRADPDVIMVGEIRDRETAQVAVEASLTGHLVLSTVHTNSAAETVTRLLDIGVDPFLLGDSLRAVVGQRLVRRLCPHCQRSRPAQPEEIRDLLRLHGGEPAATRTDWLQRYGLAGELQLHESPGCPRCCGTGRLGRIGVQEVMTLDRETRRLVQRRSPAEEIEACAMSKGMRLMRQDGVEKVLAGWTGLDEVRAACQD